MTEKAGVIIQARTDSSRFPQKVLQQIEGKSMLWHVITRSRAIGVPVIVATSDRQIDDPVAAIAEESGVDSFRGSADDVLDRYYKAAKKFSLDIILRVTADCPLLDPNKSRQVLETLREKKVDYAGIDSTFPNGLSTEVFTFQTLETAWQNARLSSEREHVTPYVYKNPDKFSIVRISSPVNLGNHRWSVDYPDDLELVRIIYSQLYKWKIFYMEDILRFLDKRPELAKINSHHSRDEGYKKSLREDRYVS